MIARLQKSMKEKDQGFTLIELLVVMIIIGILAAIAIPVFLNQRKKANDTAAKADVSTLGKELAAYYVDANTVAPAITNTSGRYTQAAVVAATGVAAWAGGDIGPSSKNMGTVSQGFAVAAGTTPVTWCVGLTYTGGSATSIAYGSAAGLGTLGTTCSSAGVVS